MRNRIIEYRDKKLLKELEEKQSPNYYRNRIRLGILGGAEKKWGPNADRFFAWGVHHLTVNNKMNIDCYTNMDIKTTRKYNHKTHHTVISLMPKYYNSTSQVVFTDLVFNQQVLYNIYGMKNADKIYKEMSHKFVPMPMMQIGVGFGLMKYTFKLRKNGEISIEERPSIYNMAPSEISYGLTVKDFCFIEDFEFYPNNTHNTHLDDKGKEKYARKVGWNGFSIISLRGCDDNVQASFLLLADYVSNSSVTRTEYANIYYDVEDYNENNNKHRLLHSIFQMGLEVFRSAFKNQKNIDKYLALNAKYI